MDNIFVIGPLMTVAVLWVISSMGIVRINRRSIDDVVSGHEKTIAEVEPIAVSQGLTAYTSNFINFIEEPLKDAVRELVDKNVPTYTSSANQRNIGKSAVIGIKYQLLSAENKHIADELVRAGCAIFGKEKYLGKVVGIYVPIPDGNVTVEFISQKMYDSARRFKPQRAKGGVFDVNNPSDNLRYLLQDDNVADKSPEEIIKELKDFRNVTHSDKTDLFYINQEVMERDERAYDALHRRRFRRRNTKQPRRKFKRRTVS
jgi:hypothetical protein